MIYVLTEFDSNTQQTTLVGAFEQQNDAIQYIFKTLKRPVAESFLEIKTARFIRDMSQPLPHWLSAEPVQVRFRSVISLDYYLIKPMEIITHASLSN